jgi:hypothetical protein
LISASYAAAYDTQLLPLVFALEVVTGALAYAGAHLGLWRLCGSPDGCERQALGALAAMMGRREKIPAN